MNDIFLDILPKIDLHGFDRDSARVRVNDFVEEAYIVGYDEILFIHGIGEGIVKNAVLEALRKNKKVFSYQDVCFVFTFYIEVRLVLLRRME